jgi:L-iditol 2-dehydrogenase
VGVDEAFQTAVAAVRKGGTLVLVGNLLPTAELPSQKVVTREITLRGSYASRGEYPACIDLIARGVVDMEVLISAVAPLEEGPGWFARLHEREPGLMKVILKP